ncbi:MAG: glycosyltransferase family 9 protein, partial [Candidatus Adiutrix sp.]
MNNILIIQMAKLGDFIQSTALIQVIRQNWPEAKLFMVCADKTVFEAASLSPHLDEIALIEEAHKRGEFENNKDSSLTAPFLCHNFKALFVLNSHPWASSLAAKYKTEKYFGPKFKNNALILPPLSQLVMAVAQRRELGRLNLVDLWRNFCPNHPPIPTFWPTTTDSPPSVSQEQTCEKSIKPILPHKRLGAAAATELQIGFQLNSRNHLRRWPVESFVDLAKQLNLLLAPLGFTFRPVLLGASQDKVLGARFMAMADKDLTPINMIGKTSLATLGELLRNLDLLISPDTGVMHLAAALNTKVLALFFGPAFGPETGPYGDGHIIYQALAPCAPCLENGLCRRRVCLNIPSVDVALQLALMALGLGDMPNSPLPMGHRVWRTFQDSFGQSLEVLAGPTLTASDVVAQAACEAFKLAC